MLRTLAHQILSTEGIVRKNGGTKEDPAAKYLALATELFRTLGNKGQPKGGTHPNDDDKTKVNWRYHNPDKLKEKKIGGRTMKWCSQDCHRRPQWCGRRNCLSNADFEAQKKRREDKKPMETKESFRHPRTSKSRSPLSRRKKILRLWKKFSVKE